MSTDSKRGGEQWVFLMVSLAVSLEKPEASKTKKIEIIKKHFFLLLIVFFAVTSGVFFSGILHYIH